MIRLGSRHAGRPFFFFLEVSYALIIIKMHWKVDDKINQSDTHHAWLRTHQSRTYAFAYSKPSLAIPIYLLAKWAPLICILVLQFVGLGIDCQFNFHLNLRYRKTFNCTRGYYSFLRPSAADIIQGRVLLKSWYNCTAFKIIPQKVPKKLI